MKNIIIVAQTIVILGLALFLGVALSNLVECSNLQKLTHSEIVIQELENSAWK
jgi:hypothetical protein